MRYVEARAEEYSREQTYRIFVTRSLQLIPQNKYIQHGYVEMLTSHHEEENEKTADEIVAEVMKNAGLRFED